MTATLTQVRTALAAVLGTIVVPGPDTTARLNVYDYNAGAIIEPAAVVMPAPGPFLDYRVDQAGSIDMRLLIGLFVSLASDQAGTANLDAYLADSGASSVYAAVAASPTLGGVVTNAGLTVAQNYGQHTYAGSDYFGCEFPVEVML